MYLLCEIFYGDDMEIIEFLNCERLLYNIHVRIDHRAFRDDRDFKDVFRISIRE